MWLLVAGVGCQGVVWLLVCCECLLGVVIGCQGRLVWLPGC